MNYARIFAAAAAGTDAIKSHMPLGFACTFIAIVVTAVIYAKGHEGGNGLVEGARFGVLVGIFAMCAVVGHNYVILNIGRKLALELAVSVLVQWTVVGIGLVYRPEAATIR